MRSSISQYEDEAVGCWLKLNVSMSNQVLNVSYIENWDGSKGQEQSGRFVKINRHGKVVGVEVSIMAKYINGMFGDKLLVRLVAASMSIWCVFQN